MATALCAVAFVGAPAAPASATADSDLARWAFWGYVFGDGHKVPGGGWEWHNPEDATVARFALGAKLNHVAVKPVKTNTFHMDGAIPPIPDLSSESADHVVAFLTGVIEGEGHKCTGLVFDDLNHIRLDLVVTLMRSAGVDVYEARSKKQTGVFVPRAQWPKVYAWPYAQKSRVPNPACP